MLTTPGLNCWVNSTAVGTGFSTLVERNTPPVAAAAGSSQHSMVLPVASVGSNTMSLTCWLPDTSGAMLEALDTVSLANDGLPLVASLER